MNENENLKFFRLVLKQEDVLFYEGVIDASKYHPLTRNYVDIRPILRDKISTLQKLLSNRHQTKKYLDYDLKSKYYDSVKKYPKDMHGHLGYNPEPHVQNYDGLVIRGVSFKLGLYLNANPIVERDFFVDGFNPDSRWSVDVKEYLDSFMFELGDIIKENDYKNVWGDFDLITKLGFNIPQIREMNNYERFKHLSRV